MPAPSASSSSSSSQISYQSADADLYEPYEFCQRTAEIKDSQGNVLFSREVVFPRAWSDTAINIVSEKYFFGKRESPFKENDLRQLIDRQVDTITNFGIKNGYFNLEMSTPEEGPDILAVEFRRRLKTILVEQQAFFNSPVNFNCGIFQKYMDGKNAPVSKSEATSGFHWDLSVQKAVPDEYRYENPQCSACFILSIGDSLPEIMDAAKNEALIFKGGSGAGSNLSQLRSSRESISGGGMSSGPISFMKGFDAFAGVIKSGGVNRRAAKLQCLDVDHGDIKDFIWCKVKEEEKAHTLIASGKYDSRLDGEAYTSVFFQNSNISIRVPDEFMQAAQEGKSWELKRRNGSPLERVNAKDLLMEAAKAAWQCGDPGMQYDTTINKWHTSKNSGPIRASNPCSEYMFLDDSACNLASINLMKFYNSFRKEFDVDGYVKTIQTLITAMDILVDLSSYPTRKIAENSHLFRPLGLGYCNLGSLLMSMGLPYDSESGRSVAAMLTSLLTAAAYNQSSKLESQLWNRSDRRLQDAHLLNRGSCTNVLNMHYDAHIKAAEGISMGPLSVVAAEAQSQWARVLKNPDVRNFQASVLAPTGTIGFALDCDTTGVEPELALVKHKYMVGGGALKIVNQSVDIALDTLDYDAKTRKQIKDRLEAGDIPEKIKQIKPEHLPVFDTSLTANGGERSIHWRGHLLMMAAVQPFISGAISKTINAPANSTPEDIFGIYMEGWKLGLKAIAVYRDGCKLHQPLSTAAPVAKAIPEKASAAPALSTRRRDLLPGFTPVIDAGPMGKVYPTINYDPETREIVEIFIRESASNEAWELVGRLASLALRAGVKLNKVLKQFRRTDGNYVIRYKFPGDDRSHSFNSIAQAVAFAMERIAKNKLSPESATPKTGDVDADPDEVLAVGPQFPCRTCGTPTVPNGNCRKCPNCGETSGCS